MRPPTVQVPRCELHDLAVPPTTCLRIMVFERIARQRVYKLSKVRSVSSALCESPSHTHLLLPIKFPFTQLTSQSLPKDVRAFILHPLRRELGFRSLHQLLPPRIRCLPRCSRRQPRRSGLAELVPRGGRVPALWSTPTSAPWYVAFRFLSP